MYTCIKYIQIKMLYNRKQNISRNVSFFIIISVQDNNLLSNEKYYVRN